MAEHQPRYPPSAFTAPDTVVSRAKFAALLAIAERVCAGRPIVCSTMRDGWTRVKLPGCVFGGVQLPPVADEASSCP